MTQFDVEKRERETRIDICCATRPGLLLSTVNTLEALGLEIQQCVISCFNDFSMQASCSEVLFCCVLFLLLCNISMSVCVRLFFLNEKMLCFFFCQQGSAQRAVANSDDIKEALFRNAGYGGKCL